ncbi:2-amino-4-hydroxy-6-hydroxymethyldihydropteridine diphosphokinase [Aeoliella sp. SH292]|uniref:2-amino-4-hydroxy-6- hydroxymethyldihydropteridine diphosphokinase n=1 Tax=Aeoliella sp. SH292 TaxID=3454464 RepID=UPI003F9C9554
MPQALLALGSNLGDAQGNIQRALAELNLLPGVSLGSSSTVHATRPIGGPAGQAEFANAAAIVATELSPSELLATLQSLELAMGRQRSERWAARVIDVDLLLYDEQILRTDKLLVPHPRMSFRPFVLNPAVEIASDWVHPQLRITLGELHQRLHHGGDAVMIYGGSPVDRHWHAAWLCERFAQLSIALESEQETLLAVDTDAISGQPRLAIQLQTSDESPRSGLPTLAISAAGRDEVTFDTEAAVVAVWPDLGGGAGGE